MRLSKKLLILIFVALISCGKNKTKEYKLSEGQKKINVYEVGDSITFKEMNTGELYGFKVQESKTYSKIYINKSAKCVSIFNCDEKNIEHTDVVFLVDNKYTFKISLSVIIDLSISRLGTEQLCSKNNKSCYKLDIYTSGPFAFKDSTVTLNNFTFDKVLEIESLHQTSTTFLFAEGYGLVQIQDTVQNLVFNIQNPVKLK